MKHTIEVDVDFGALGKHECKIGYELEAGEPQYNGDNGSAPGCDASCEIYEIMKGEQDFYEIVEVYFPKELERLYELVAA